MKNGTRIKSSVRNSQLGICSYCFKMFDKLTVDHIVSRCNGGTHAQDNLTPSCYSCNYRKGTKHLIIFIAEMNGCRRIKKEVSTLNDTNSLGQAFKEYFQV